MESWSVPDLTGYDTRCRKSWKTASNGIPGIAREVFADAGEQLRELDVRIAAYDRRIASLARDSEPAKRLMKIEGVGPVTATAVIATVGDGKVFRNGRQFAAWLGLSDSRQRDHQIFSSWAIHYHRLLRRRCLTIK